MPDALSRLEREDMPRTNIDDSFPDHLSSHDPVAYAGPRGPVLDRVLLGHLTPAVVDGQHDEWPLSGLQLTQVTVQQSFLSSIIRTCVSLRFGKLTSFPSQSAQRWILNPPLDPEAPTRRSNRSRTSSVHLRPLGGSKSQNKTAWAPTRELPSWLCPIILTCRLKNCVMSAQSSL